MRNTRPGQKAVRNGEGPELQGHSLSLLLSQLGRLWKLLVAVVTAVMAVKWKQEGEFGRP